MLISQYISLILYFSPTLLQWKQKYFHEIDRERERITERNTKYTLLSCKCVYISHTSLHFSPTLISDTREINASTCVSNSLSRLILMHCCKCVYSHQVHEVDHLANLTIRICQNSWVSRTCLSLPIR